MAALTRRSAALHAARRHGPDGAGAVDSASSAADALATSMEAACREVSSPRPAGALHQVRAHQSASQARLMMPHLFRPCSHMCPERLVQFGYPSDCRFDVALPSERSEDAAYVGVPSYLLYASARAVLVAAAAGETTAYRMSTSICDTSKLVSARPRVMVTVCMCKHAMLAHAYA
eukprot:6192469-Pleurochrysis_carterae.AAC.1